jgi:pantoate--beta-alanine ligase
MLLIKTKSELHKFITQQKLSKNCVGFVPTMGALHAGHLSLMKKCRSENDLAIASIFVNPTQFNDKNDLKNYPRTLEKDLSMLENEGCDVVFYPEVNEIYPEPDNRKFDFGNLDKIMEGAYRPGHFNGVAQIVTKLFDAVMPDLAYFGQKDFQQLAIIKKIVRDYAYSIKIIACPIVREQDGLAMSSRNLLLGSNERQAAPLISLTLTKANQLKTLMDFSTLKKWVVEQIDCSPYLKTEYFEIIDETELQPANSWNAGKVLVGCIAVKAGNIRLIDNITFS